MRCLSESRVRTLRVSGQEDKPKEAQSRHSVERQSRHSVESKSTPTDWVWLALTQTRERRRLLQSPSHLRSILNDIPARRLLWEQACLGDGREACSLVVDMMKCSRAIWRGGLISAQIYDEAIARTWVWFIDQLPSYDPEKASFTTWFNNRLKWMILEESRRALPLPNQTEIYDSFVSPGSQTWENLLNEWIELVRRDQQLMKCRMQGNLRLSCQGLLLSILAALQEVGEFSWEAIAQQQEIDPAVLKRFCRRRCFARFKELTSE